MKFVAIADTHGKHENVKLPSGDVLIHAGDVSMSGKRTEVMEFLSWFEQQDFEHKILIAGNHDFYFEIASEQVLQQVIPQGIVYLKDSMTILNGVTIWGSPITPWFYDWAFNRHRGEAIKKHWDLIPDNIDILITHGPVFGIVDTSSTGQHVGCKDLLAKVKAIQPAFHICGHIHEAYGTVTQHNTTFINASILDANYKIKNAAVEFEVR